MNPTEIPDHAALIVQAGAALNSLNATLRALGEFKTPDKKLQAGWSELRRLSSTIYTRLIARLDGPTGDYINEVSNQSEQLLRCLAYLPADQRRKLVSHAEDVAWHRAGLYEADTESQLRTRWAAYATVRANALAAHPHLTL